MLKCKYWSVPQISLTDIEIEAVKLQITTRCPHSPLINPSRRATLENIQHYLKKWYEE